MTATDLADADSDAGTPAPHRRGHARWIVPLVVVAVAAATRLIGLGTPDDLVFDEIYYVPDARDIVAQGVESTFVVHPPVGKWVIAAGIATVGDDPVGWRVGPALVGTFAVAATYALALRLCRRRGLAALAAFAVALDGLAITSSRMAMVDATLMALVVTALWLAVVDRDRTWASVPSRRSGDAPTALPLRTHGARWAAGAVMGLAIATKWSALAVLGGLVVGCAIADACFRRRTTGRFTTEPLRLVADVALPLLILPALVYVATYAPWFANVEGTRVAEQVCSDDAEGCGAGLDQVAGAWIDEQRAIAGFHLQLEADHPYRSTAVTWPLQLRPVAYHYTACEGGVAPDGEACTVAEGSVRHVVGVGSIALWWPGTLAVVAAGVMAVARRDADAAIIVGTIGALYVPWLIAARPLFLFYMVPAVPVLAVALAWVLSQMGRRWRTGLAAAAVVALVAAFAVWWPVWSGAEITRDAWEWRMLLPGWI